eukprot:UN33155
MVMVLVLEYQKRKNVGQEKKKNIDKHKKEYQSNLQGLPIDIQSMIFDNLTCKESFRLLVTCKQIFTEHAISQTIEAIRRHNLYFKARLLKFTLLLKWFADLELLVDDLNELHEISLRLTHFFSQLDKEQKKKNNNI